MLRELLEGEGYAVEAVGDGAEALARVRAAPPDLLVTDAVMPGLDGFSLCRTLRAEARFERLPILLVSASYRAPHDERLAEAAGASAFLRKPAVVAEWRRAVQAAPAAKPPAPIPESEFAKLLAEVLGTQLTHRKQEIEEQRAQRRAAEAHFRDIFDQVNDLILVIEPGSGRILEANRRAGESLGYSSEELRALTVLELGPPEEADFVRGNLRRLGETGAVTYERQLCRRDGTRFPCEVSARRTTLEGRVVIVGVVRDISERKRAEQLLTEKQRLLSESQQIARIGSWSLDFATQELSWSEELYRVYGVAPDDFALNPESFLALIHPDDRPAMQAWIDDCIAGKGPGELEFRVVLPTGDTRVLSGRGVLYRDAGNRPVRLSGTAQDITERKRVETEKTELLARNAVLMAALAEIYYEWWPKTDEVRWSGEYARVLGYSTQEIGCDTASWTSRVHPDDLDAVLIEIQNAQREDRVYDLEYRFRRRDGSYAWMHDRGVLMRDADGKLASTRGVFRDITERRQAEEALRESARKLNNIVNNLSGFVYRCANAPGWPTEYVSQGILDLLGYPAEDFMSGKRMFGHCIESADQDRVWREVQAGVEARRPYVMEYRVRTAAGQERWVRERGAGVFDDGTLVALEGIVTDITARKQTEAALHERDEILRLFVEHSPAAIGMFDNEMRYVAVSRRWLSDYGLGDRNIIGRSHYEIFPEIPQRWRDIHRRCLAGATEHCDEDPFVRADGRTDWVKWEICPWRKADGAIGGIIIFSELVTARKQAEEALRESSSQLQTLSRRVLEAQEVERRRLARELHDELGQALTAIKINLQARDRLKNQTPAELDAENLRIVEETLQQVRRLALALRPSMLDDLGLGPALRWMAEQQVERGGFAVQFGADFPDIRLAPELETACFRIAQEALTNIARHAHAKRVVIELRHEGDTLRMTVQDDGCGFDVAVAHERAKAGDSVGVLGMQERAALIGGQIEIVSAPKQGTTVRARFPWRARAEAG